MGDDVLGSLLLDHAGLSPSENRAVFTSAGNLTTFNNTKHVLILQHGRLHVRQTGMGESGRGPQLFYVDAAQTQLPEQEQGQGALLQATTQLPHC
eukprot:7888530-Pyramimonas_sp.AAC.1